MAHPGARPCGRVGGDRGREEARAGGDRNVVAGLGAAAGGGSAGRRAGRGAFVLARDAVRAVAGAGRWRARSRPRHHRDSRAADLEVAGGGHRATAGPGAGGVPRRHQRGAADRLGGGGRGLVPGARSRVGQRSADRSGGPRPRGGVRGRGAVAHGGLVHQPDAGAARSRGARSGGGDGRRSGARPCAQADQGAAAGTARQRAGLRAAALPQPGDGAAACGPCGAAARVQLSGAVCGRRGRRLGGLRRGNDARWRRRPGDGAGACGRGERTHARRERWRNPDGELDLCAGADR